MSEGTTAGWGYSFERGLPDDLVDVLTVALAIVWKDAQCFDDLRRYDSLKWTFTYRGDPDDPEVSVGLAVMMSRNGQDLYGFGLSTDLDQPTATYRIADEFQNEVLDDYIQWPTIDGKIVTARTLDGEAVWHRKWEKVAKIGSLCNHLSGKEGDS